MPYFSAIRVSVQKLDRWRRTWLRGGMPRSIRIQSAGAYYHVMARGNRREEIFHDDDDRCFFLHTLGQACEMTGWRGNRGQCGMALN